MGDKTGISWTDATWNPVRGCSRVSEGCRHCYAEQQAARIVRMGKGKPTAYDGLVKLVGGEARWTGEVRLVSDHLADPLKWRAPRRIFVNSMSDLFHEKLTNEQIAAVFGVMAAAPQHTFQVLTKRAKRMREWFVWIVREAIECNDRVGMAIASRCFVEAQRQGDIVFDLYGRPTAMRSSRSIESALAAQWPLPNVWLGVSVENQDAADERIPELLETPAAVRFLSCEPLLGPVDIAEYFDPCSVPCGEEPWPELSWVIAGCESGPGARPCDVAWLRSLRDQCATAGVPFFLKQATPTGHPFIENGGSRFRITDGAIRSGDGSKVNGRTPPVIELPYLDGVQHKEFPK